MYAAAELERLHSTLATPVEHAELFLEQSVPLARRPSAYSAPPSPSALPGSLVVGIPPVLPVWFEALSPTDSVPSVTTRSSASRSSSSSMRASFFSDSFSPVRVYAPALRPAMTTLSVQLNEIVHFIQLRQSVVARVAVSRMLKEFRVISQLPHPGFMREMLVEAEQFLPRDMKCARIVVEEAKEYLELLSFDVARGKHVFPGSSAQERKSRLSARMERWNASKVDPSLRDLKYKSACLNPCYRDLLFISVWSHGKQG